MGIMNLSRRIIADAQMLFVPFGALVLVPLLKAPYERLDENGDILPGLWDAGGCLSGIKIAKGRQAV